MRCSLEGSLRRLVHCIPGRILLLLVCVIFFPAASRAQTGVYATFNASDFEVPNVGWQYGPTFGLYHDFLHVPLLGVGFDARATLLGSGSTKAYMGLIGPHIQLHPHVLPFMPYVEGLIGGGNVQVGQGVATVNKTAVAYEGVVGLDWTILPHVDWRVAEYSFGGFSSLNASVSPRTLATGLVVRLP
jgi:hypothetical protein